MKAAIQVHIRIGTAGWQLPADLRPTGSDRSALTKYAELFNAVEVNSSFYRYHMPRTYARWAASVPVDFRFAVKMHRDVTHVQRLQRFAVAKGFLESVSPLGDRLGPVLVQLPPSLAYLDEHADFFEALREHHEGEVVLEPRHASWNAQEVVQLLAKHRITRVTADPPLGGERFEPLSDGPLAYFRLHGSPVMYRSAYSAAELELVAGQLRQHNRTGKHVYVVFDNTASGAAASNALALRELVKHSPRIRS